MAINDPHCQVEIMNNCAVLDWSSSFLEPAPLDRKDPGEVDWFEGDLSDDADCSGLGVIISTVVTTIRTEDDDGNLTLGASAQLGLVFRIPYTIDAATPDSMYSILATITLSDGRTIKRWQTLPVVATKFNYG